MVLLLWLCCRLVGSGIVTLGGVVWLLIIVWCGCGLALL